MLQHSILVKNERRETHAEQRGIILMIKHTYPLAKHDLMSCKKNKIKMHERAVKKSDVKHMQGVIKLIKKNKIREKSEELFL